jgi:DNA-binding transcriptional MerR regulator
MAKAKVKYKEIHTSNPVHRGQAFFAAIEDYCTSEKARRVSKLLNEKQFTVRDTQFSYRQVNHWETKGLFDSSRSDDSEWRRFSIVDLVWLNVVWYLRSFGVSTSGIEEVKRSLDELVVTDARTDVVLTSYLEFYVARAWLHKLPTYVLVFPNGDAEPVYFEQYLATLKVYLPSAHLLISINEILQMIVPGSDMRPVFATTTVEVVESEYDLLEILRTANFDTATIHRRDGKVDYIKVTESIDAKRRIADILAESDYQNVEVAMQDGKIVRYVRTLTKKVENKC